MACMLLLQITAFLRETFQMLPRSKLAYKNTGSTSGWEKLMSHRRWSILSNTFNQQAPISGGSIHSINELHPSAAQCERRISYSTADEVSLRGSHDFEVFQDEFFNIFRVSIHSHDLRNKRWYRRRQPMRRRHVDLRRVGAF